MSDGHERVTYSDVHKLIGKAAERIIQSNFKPDLIIAIGGGGFFPARVMRTFLKDPSTKRNIPILAIGLSLYESLPGTTEEQLGKAVVRTQWLGPSKELLGRKALIIDEVDDSRTTLEYAVKELQKDMELELAKLDENEREGQQTKFGIFVVHNKRKPKAGTLPPDIPYFAGAEVDDVWLDYPWEMKDIDEHDRLAALAKEAPPIPQ
ncbi:Hypoxanthine-guanine phosphoribosyltransferase Short=HGPRT; Short=HGPRTase [Serendipita indica DSM 11827]|nr:Hypoxanthine-guanine phosphoribosyltransferase Short=HGPRT; Short=HGPRTase [Serendipita indica DSM 11827]